MKRYQNRKAFTIVEMVIVIAVIAILAAAMIPAVSGVIRQANISADRQFAASLNIQLAMWEVDNGEIASESNLRVAINDFYGKWEDEEKTTLAADGDFYAALEPKSGKYGYHYWWNATDKQVVLAKYEELLPDDGAAPTEVGILSFSPASPRSLLIPTAEGEKNFFLMDQAGSELADYLKGVDSIAVAGEHAILIGNLEALEDDAALGSLVAGKLSVTAVANENGLFFDNGTATYVYIPAGTTQLGASKISVDATLAVEKIDLPVGVKLLTNSLVGFKTDSSAWNKPLATTIFVDAEVSELADIFSAASTNCVIQIPDGTRYIIDGYNILRLKEDGTTENVGSSDFDYATELKSFAVSGTSSVEGKAHIHFGAANIIHYASDFDGTITLRTSEFVDENGPCDPRAVTWTGIEGTKNADGSIEIPGSALQGGGSIKVSSTDGVEYTISMVKVETEAISVAINNQSKVDNKYEFEYNSTDITYTMVTTVYVTDDLTCMKPHSKPVITTEGILDHTTNDGAYVEIDGAEVYQYTTTLSFADKVNTKGNQTENISVTCGGVTRTANVTLKDTSKAAFVIADNADTQNKYGVQFTIGTVNPIRLDTLFAPESDGALTGRDSISVTAKLGSNTVYSKSGLTAATWAGTTIDLSSADGDGTLTITINDGTKDIPITAKLVPGAHNVTSATDWENVPNSTSIVLLNDITFPNVEISAMNNGAGYYSKNIGSASVYGNLNQIKFGTFLIKVKSNNYFLRMGNKSTLNDLIIDGPAYGTRQMTQNTNGYFVSGVETTSTSKINNCYISGFRVPIYAQGDTEISNSVINGGTVANIYIHTSINLKLTNVETYQGVHGSAKIGGGIFVDHGNSAGSTVTITANNFKQNNYYTETEIKDFCNSVASGSWNKIKSNVAGLLVGSDYHIGVITSCENKNYPVSVTVINGYKSGTYHTDGILGFGYRDFVAYGNGNNLPAKVDSYSIADDFLGDSSRLKNS